MKKILATLSIGLLLLPIAVSVAPRPAYAFDIVHDPLNFIKNTITAIETHITSINSVLQTQYLTVLNPLATVIARTALMNQGFDWIRTLSQGAAPGATSGYVTNLAQNLLAVRNGAADSFIQQYLANGAITSPQRSLATQALNDFNRCSNSFTGCHADTLAQYTSNPNAIRSGDIVNGGGIQGFAGLLLHPDNNIIGQDQAIRSGLQNSAQSAQAQRETELNWGQGFLSGTAPGCGQSSAPVTSASASSTTVTAPAVSLNPVDHLVNCAIRTPSSIIHDITSHFSNSGSIAQSDTHNIGELLTTFLLHMVSQVMTNGLSGASAPSSANNGTGGTGLDTTPSLTSGGGLGVLIDQQITNVNTFQHQWQQILAAAQTATATLTGNGTCAITLPDGTATTGSAFLDSVVTPAVTAANTQLAKVTPSLAQLNVIKTEASRTDATSAATAGQDFNNLFNASVSPFYPSLEDFSYANAQSNTTDGTSLISQITTANSQCGGS